MVEGRRPLSWASVDVLDLAGLALVAAAIGWTLAAAAASGGSPIPVVSLLAASAVSLTVGRVASSRVRWAAPAIVLAAALALFLASPGATLSGSPLYGPFGYANAAGAFFVQAAVAGLMVAVSVRSTGGRALGVAAAIVFGLVPFAKSSLAAASLVAVLPALALTARGGKAVRLVIATCGALFVLVLASTIVLGATFTGGPRVGAVDRVVDRTLSERRVALWHDALEIMNEEPVTGVGPGRFQVTSPTAVGDADARWAHDEFLQQGAEGGLVGFGLLLALFLWGFVRLRATPGPDIVTALGAVALAALGIHASVDYVLHFPAVPIAAAALVGTAQAPRKMDDPSLGAEKDALELAGP